MRRVGALGCLLFFTLAHQKSCDAVPILSIPLLKQSALALYKGVKSYMDMKNEGIMSEETADIVGRLASMSDDFQEMKNRIISKISSELKNKITGMVEKFFDNVKGIQHVYEEFVENIQTDGVEKSILHQFATEVTSPSISPIKNKIKSMYEALFDEDFVKDSVFTILLRDSTAMDTMCIRGQSSQMMIRDLYQVLIETHTKGLVMLLYAYDLRATPKETFESWKNSTLLKYETMVSNARQATMSAISKASREVWKCDPFRHVKDFTYLKLDGVLQYFFVYQSDIKDHPDWQMFVLSCSKYKDERLSCRSFPCQSQPIEKKCYGHLRDCEFLESSLQICHSPKESDRRYEWVRLLKSKHHFGHRNNRENGYCPYYTQGLSSVLNVDNCMCTCDSEKRDVNRYISLRAETSDTHLNKVITGVRFIEVDHVFYLQIEQGTLGPFATIIDKPEWKNVLEYATYGIDWQKILKSYTVDSDEWTEFYANQYVYTVTYKNHTVYLDDLEVEPGNVVTALRFTNYYNGLLLVIRQSPFEYSTGKLYPGSKWIKNYKPKAERDEVILEHPDEPIRTQNSEDYSFRDKYVELRMSDKERDLGQNIVPYFDAQPVTLNPPVPLQGIGLFHKGSKYSGGFIAPKIIHYDLSKEEDIVPPDYD